MRVVEAAVHPDVRGVQAALLARLPQGGFHGAFGAVPGTAEQPPGAAVVAPGRAVLEQHLRTVRAGPGQEQAGSPEETPVPVPEAALDPAVAVAPGVGAPPRRLVGWVFGHGSRLPGALSARCRELVTSRLIGAG